MKLKKLILITMVTIWSLGVVGAFGAEAYKPLTQVQLNQLSTNTEKLLKKDMRNAKNFEAEVKLIQKDRDDLSKLTNYLQTIKQGKVASNSNIPQIAEKIKTDDKTTLAEHLKKLNNTEAKEKTTNPDTENIIKQLQDISETLKPEVKEKLTQVQRLNSAPAE